MADQVTNYKCPSCAGVMEFSAKLGKLECKFCGSTYEVAEVEEMLRAENEAAAAAMAEGGDSWDTGGLSNDWGSDAEGMKTYECPSCGAQLLCDANTAATCCPYCGNQTVVPGQFAGMLKPEFVIPFKMDKNEAKAALTEHYKGKKLLPASFVEGNHIEELQGVYVPFWLFDCEASGKVIYEARKSSTKRSGDVETTTTNFFDVRRGGTVKYEKLPVDASTRMPDAHMDSIEPYNYKELKPFSMAYMPGYLADKYDVSAEECGSRMEERAKQTFLDEMDKTVKDYDSHTVVDSAVRVKKGQVHYAMLPVWLLATKWNDQQFLFAMNGQTGKLVGDLPVDKGKYWGWLGGIAAVGIALMMLYNFVIRDVPMGAVMMALLCIGLPLLIGWAVASSMAASMKSVGKQKAADYIGPSGLHITERLDTFLRTETKTRNLSSGKDAASSGQK